MIIYLITSRNSDITSYMPVDCTCLECPLQGPTLNAVKYQVCRLMRMLVELTNTLEQVGTDCA